MGLFDGIKKKDVRPNTSVKYTNNITERLTSLLVPRFAKGRVYLVESGDPKFVNIMIEGIPDILGVITRNPKNEAVNIGIYLGRGFVNAFVPEAQEALQVYVNREIDRVVNPYM